MAIPTRPRLRPSDVALRHPEWSAAASIYQLNTRQFTAEGTFRAAEAHLPRLAELGVDILWLMPVHEVGTLHRKGTLGSPYAVKDHYSVNPELGTVADLRHFVDAAHSHGFRVLLDWVANHTAWDHVLVAEHPEWYLRGPDGGFVGTPWWDWDDIIDLDYDQPDLRDYMVSAMEYWVREVGVDGYRCDVAGFVPTDFWEDVRAALERIRPVFLLAEWESRELHHRAFDMTYAWSWHEAMRRVAAGQADVDALRVYYAWNAKAFRRDSIRMLFVSNHDTNAWEGTASEQFGDMLDTAVALSVLSEGMPLIYNGQEAGYDKRLEFFERDPIVWRDHPMGDLYRWLLALKKAHPALWNGTWGAPMVELPTTDRHAVLAFVRDAGDDSVVGIFNLSPESRTVRLLGGSAHGDHVDVSSGATVVVAPGTRVDLDPWQYFIFVRP
ncbi:alpha-amlyase [Cellulomonas sp. Root930]|nr:alpha-amlyase [Cellulomonas sp. Root930]